MEATGVNPDRARTNLPQLHMADLVKKVTTALSTQLVPPPSGDQPSQFHAHLAMLVQQVSSAHQILTVKQVTIAQDPQSQLLVKLIVPTLEIHVQPATTVN